MVQFETFDDGVEAKGQTIKSMLAGAGDLSSVFEKRMNEMLAENGIEDLQADEWYSNQAYLDSFEAVADSIGEQTVANIGKKIPENAEWPPGIDSVSAGLESIDDAYQMNHRGGEIGYYDFELTGDSEGEIACKNPYPCAMDEGLVTAVAEKFSAEGALVEVEEVGDSCRASGGEECVYRVSW
ncbi:hypothetical protein NGM10_09860 [Halorussus salilacus]|uniref:hypothetical protein n=1 Tax=Halorussus salilacus TaxID=2953750 RepID=UPI00209E45F2|nr:hypothetical protein [Halorussus salilacus]USZ67034.1 hypothetical protein NGM10_09860 [Halorussus salilacus]